MLEVLRRKVADETAQLDRLEAEHRAVIASRPNPPPSAQPYGVSPRGAELIVCEWMRHLGALDAEVTQYSGDGGVDVSSGRWIAQVKHYEGTVGVSPVRELAGVAAVEGRGALFFTSTGYAAGATEFADRARVALFLYSVEQGTLAGANALATDLLDRGLT